MLSAKPKVGDIVTWTNVHGQRSVWKIVGIERDSMRGTLLSSEVPETDLSNYVNQSIGVCHHPGWSLDFSQWVLNTRKDHANKKA